jgi:hypothetical protein
MLDFGWLTYLWQTIPVNFLVVAVRVILATHASKFDPRLPRNAFSSATRAFVTTTGTQRPMKPSSLPPLGHEYLDASVKIARQM